MQLEQRMSRVSGVNEFLFCLDAFFYEMGQLLNQPVLHTQILDEFRYQMSQAMVSFERQAIGQKIPTDLIGHAQYALVAFVDEWVMYHAGMDSEWVTHPLQLEYFGENTAGERFFSVLAQLRLRAEHFIAVLEIFYLCLELGYQGQYRLQDSTELLNLKRELHAQIQQIRGISNKVFFPFEESRQAVSESNSWFRRMG